MYMHNVIGNSTNKVVAIPVNPKKKTATNVINNIIAKQISTIFQLMKRNIF